MNTILIAGAGQLGSRHLQALKKVSQSLEITVVDPSKDALDVARQRYESIEGEAYPISYTTDIPTKPTDFTIAIVACNSNARRSVIEKIVSAHNVQFFILEKILFQNKSDYDLIGKLLNKKKISAFVNCSMRKIDFYNKMKSDIGHGPIQYLVTGSRYGLITNSIHYVDHMAYLTGCTVFDVRTDDLDPAVIDSKRKGFKEINGALHVSFDDGSTATMLCYKNGDLPVQVEITSPVYRCISRESEQKAWICKASNNWKWEDADAAIPFQSQATAELVTELLDKGTCPLVEYDESTRIHLSLFEPLLQFLTNNTGYKDTLYPFT
ncbi:oxidoreductase [Spirochaetota bacterium]